MDGSFAGLASLCVPDVAKGGLAAGLMAGLFLAGAAGSVVHCTPMCGGFVLGQASDRMARVPAAQLCEWRRLRAGLLLPYHLGRLTTYALLGAGAASSVAVLGRLPWFTRLSAVLMAAAAAVFLFEALARMGAVRSRVPGVHPTWPRLIGRLTRRISRERAMGGYLLGLALGFLPCSFLYGAIFAAAASGNWMRGAAGMLCFGLGTVPMLVVVGVIGHTVRRRWHRGAAVMTPVLMMWNAAMLLGAAWMQLA